MILIDMPMPDRCLNCPCSYWIMTGSNSGRMMCNVMEVNKKRDVLVDERKNIRPENCPIKMETK